MRHHRGGGQNTTGVRLRDGAINASGETKIIGIDNEAAQAPCTRNGSTQREPFQKNDSSGGLSRRGFFLLRAGVAKKHLNFFK